MKRKLKPVVVPGTLPPIVRSKNHVWVIETLENGEWSPECYGAWKNRADGRVGLDDWHADNDEMIARSRGARLRKYISANIRIADKA